MSGIRNTTVPDSSSMGKVFYTAPSQIPPEKSVYFNLYQKIQKMLESYPGVKWVQSQQLNNVVPLSTTPLSDYSNVMMKQNNLSIPSPQYSFPKSNGIGITHNFVNQISPTGDGSHQLSMDNESTIASTIQFNLGNSNHLNCSQQQTMGTINTLDCSSQQMNTIDFSTPYSTYSSNASSIGMGLPNQTCFSHDSSLTSNLWNIDNGFPCGSSSQGNLTQANLGNDSTVDYTARWDVDGSLDNSATSSQAAMSSTSKNLSTTPCSIPEEMRLRPFISEPPKAVELQIERVRDHRLYVTDRKLVGVPQSPTGCDFQVMAPTGHEYTVRIANIPSCTCPDPQHACVHFLFIMLRVLKLSDQDPRIWQTALLTSEVRDLLRLSRNIDGRGVASPQVRQWYHQDISSSSQVGDLGNGDRAAGTLPREVSGECPVCFENLTNHDAMGKEELSFCKVCGNSVHKDCFNRWCISRSDAGEGAACIFCRSTWMEDNPISKKRKAEAEIGSDGYGNLVEYPADNRGEDLSTMDRLYSQARPKYMREWRAY